MGNCPGGAETGRRCFSPAWLNPATYLFPGSLAGVGTGGAFPLGPATCFSGQNQRCDPHPLPPSQPSFPGVTDGQESHRGHSCWHRVDDQPPLCCGLQLLGCQWLPNSDHHLQPPPRGPATIQDLGGNEGKRLRSGQWLEAQGWDRGESGRFPKYEPWVWPRYRLVRMEQGAGTIRVGK